MDKMCTYCLCAELDDIAVFEDLKIFLNCFLKKCNCIPHNSVRALLIPNARKE